VKPGQVSLLFATAALDENDEQLEALRQTMIESRTIADAAEQDYLDYKRTVELARQLQQTVPEVTEAAGCSCRCSYCSGNCPYR
jgi:tRNA A37 methylthiotransferase MiaB